MDEEELDGIEIDNILTLENLPRTGVHHLKVGVDGGELTRKLLSKRSQTFYKPINLHSVTYTIGESVPSTST